MSTINASWHKANRMPKNPTPLEKAKWHVAHEMSVSFAHDTPETSVSVRELRMQDDVAETT